MKYPPLLLKYLKMFQDDPSSRIFAPLAESYRKLGLVDQAIEICKEGLAANPEFIGGKVALSRAYADINRHKDVVDMLRSVVELMPDNLVAQKLFADSCMALGDYDAALASYKLMLYFNPSDQQYRQIVQDLEGRSVASGGLLRPVMKLQTLLARVQSRARPVLNS